MTDKDAFENKHREISVSNDEDYNVDDCGSYLSDNLYSAYYWWKVGCEYKHKSDIDKIKQFVINAQKEAGDNDTVFMMNILLEKLNNS